METSSEAFRIDSFSCCFAMAGVSLTCEPSAAVVVRAPLAASVVAGDVALVCGDTVLRSVVLTDMAVSLTRTAQKRGRQAVHPQLTASEKYSEGHNSNFARGNPPTARLARRDVLSCAGFIVRFGN